MLLLTTAFYSCQNKSKHGNIKLLRFYYEYGDGRSYIFISDTKTVIDSAKSNPPNEEVHHAPSFVLSQASFTALNEFLQRSCVEVDPPLTGSEFWAFTMDFEKSSIVCAYKNKDEIMKEAKKIVEWMERSEFKGEFADLIKTLKPYEELYKEMPK